MLVALVVGFGALGLGTIAAHAVPATSYEPSIYSGTPLLFWVGFCVAFSISIVIAFRAKTRFVGGLSLGLAGLSTATLIALPLIRGYYYLGEADAMTHLGWTIDIATGTVRPIDVLYPAVHLLSIAISAAAGLELRHALMLLVVVFGIVYILFVPLVVRLISKRRKTLTIATFAACLLLPINLIAVHLQIHPSSQALFFLPAMLYLFFVYTSDPSTQYLALSILTGIGFVLVHPLHAGNAVIVFGAIAVVQLAGRFSTEQVINRNLLITALFGAIFLMWVLIAAFDQLVGILSIFVSSFLSDPTSSGTVAEQGTSLTTLGSGLGTLFVKLFLVSFVFCVLAGVLMLDALVRLYRYHSRPDSFSEASWRMVYLTIGFIPIAGLFAVLLLADISSIAFRYLGFILVVVTIMGSIALSRADRLLSSRFSRPSLDASLSVVFIIFLTMSLLVVFPSPYVYLPTGHVPESQFDGYETAFETQDDEIPYLALRSQPYRYSDAIHGDDAFSRADHFGGQWQTELPDGFADGDLSAEYDEPHYLVVTERDRVNEVTVYGELRFAEDDFADLETEVGINRVQSSGGLDRYLITPDGTDGGEVSE